MPGGCTLRRLPRRCARRAWPGPADLRLDEAQGHAVAFADRLVLRIIGLVVLVGRRQRPNTVRVVLGVARVGVDLAARIQLEADRKSTRLNSSHSQISYAVFCLKKKKKYT